MRRAAPVGFRRPRSQLATVTVGMFIRAAKMGWLTFSFRRMERTCAGVSALTGGGSGTVVVRKVSFCLPCRCRANASALPTRSSALNSTSLVFMAVFSFNERDGGLEALFLLGT
jgi:hypothetical protein